MATTPDRAERLTNVLALLLESSTPLTADDVFFQLGDQYPAGLAARRQAFERDKATLRDIGVPIEGAILGGTDAGKTGYSIDRHRYELDALELDADETQALQVAVAAIRSGTPVGTEALIKLGAGATEVDVAVSANVPTLNVLPVLREAVAGRHPVEFEYRSTPRRVEPYGLLLRSGFWYVVGLDHGHGEPRTFRVDRIADAVDVDRDTTFDRPSIDVDQLFPSDPKLLGGQPGSPDHTTAVVRIDPRRAPSIEREVGSDRVVTRHPDGSVDLDVPCTNRDAFRSWVLGLVDAAEVIGPDEVRSDVVSWLHSTVDVAETDVSDELTALAGLTDDEVPGSGASTRPQRSRGAGRRSAKRTAEERVRRMLLMLPWLTERGEVALDEVASRFDMTPAEVEADIGWASMCGLPPYVDEMIDVFVDDGTVFVGVPRLFTKPLRLTAPEGFALLTAGRAAMALPGADPSGPLGRGLAKLADVLGDDERGLVLELDRPANADELAEAVRSGERLELDYWSPSRDEVTTRAVTPRRMFSDRGYWYLSADDHGVGERRTFRLDRIEAIRHLAIHDDAPFEPDVSDEPAGGGSGADRAWFSDGAIPRVTLLLLPPAYWVAERYPIDAAADTTVDTDRPARVVRLAVSSERWLERLLLRLGTDATVVDPPQWRSLGADAARRVLRRYDT